MEVIATEDYSRLTSDMQLLEVSIEDWQPAASRQTTLSIGPQVWPLGRTDTVFVHAGREISRLVAYQLFGDVTDDILSALLRPSDVVVSAKLVTDPNADPQVPEPAPTGNVAVRSGGGTPTRGFGGEEPPPAVLRFETRSTQLASAIEEYRACYDGP